MFVFVFLLYSYIGKTITGNGLDEKYRLDPQLNDNCPRLGHAYKLTETLHTDNVPRILNQSTFIFAFMHIYVLHVTTLDIQAADMLSVLEAILN